MTSRAAPLFYSAALLSALAGIGVAFFPVKPLTIPHLDDIDIADQQPVIIMSTFEAAAARFDLSNLPAPRQPEAPPPDPAERLRTYKFLGMASSGELVRAMFADPSGPLTLAPGDELAGFILERAEPHRAVFSKDGLEVELLVNPP